MEKFKFDVVSKTLTITAKFAAKMNNPKAEEYKRILQLRKDFPDLRIVQRTHKTPASYTTKSGDKTKRNQYKDLTYERMEKFISALPQPDKYLREYTIVREFADAARHNGYPLVRCWFEQQFPNYRKNPLFYVYNTPALVTAAEVVRGAEQHKANQDDAA